MIEAEVIEAEVIEAEVIEAEVVEATVNNDTVPESDGLIDAWPHLSQHTRAAILMLVEADQMTR